MAHLSLALQDPKAPLDPKALQVVLDLQVNLDQTVKVQSLDLQEILVVLDQTESQGILVTWGIQVRTLQYAEMKGTMGTQGAWGQMVQRDFQGPRECQASPDVQERKVCKGLQV